MRELTSRELSTVSGGATSPSGWFECINGYSPIWLGGGLCTGSTGDVYLELGAGTPGGSYSAGVSSNVNGYLTQFSVEAAMGSTFTGGNASSLAAGYHFGSPGMSVNYGWDLGSPSALESSISNFADNLWGYICEAVDDIGICEF